MGRHQLGFGGDCLLSRSGGGGLLDGGGDRRALTLLLLLCGFAFAYNSINVGPMPGLLGLLHLHDEPKNVGLVVFLKDVTSVRSHSKISDASGRSRGRPHPRERSLLCLFFRAPPSGPYAAAPWIPWAKPSYAHRVPRHPRRKQKYIVTINISPLVHPPCSKTRHPPPSQSGQQAAPWRD
jgi:hypothetical protein